MHNLVQEINYQFNFNKLKKETPKIKGTDIITNHSGVSVQHRLNIPNPWNLIDGLESLRSYTNAKEHDFHVLHENFKNTEYEKIINDFNLVRSRILYLEEKYCYSIHQDKTWRLHIPIKTNPDCLFYFPDHKEHFHLEEGKVYKVNTTERHTFFNAGWDNRIHFMGCLECEARWKLQT